MKQYVLATILTISTFTYITAEQVNTSVDLQKTLQTELIQYKKQHHEYKKTLKKLEKKNDTQDIHEKKQLKLQIAELQSKIDDLTKKIKVLKSKNQTEAASTFQYNANLDNKCKNPHSNNKNNLLANEECTSTF